MSQHHDPIRHINNLRQSLEHNKKPIGFFLGAGCPSAIKILSDGPPLIPNIEGMRRITSL